MRAETFITQAEPLQGLVAASLLLHVVVVAQEVLERAGLVQG